jgi:hypothetical protein
MVTHTLGVDLINKISQLPVQLPSFKKHSLEKKPKVHARSLNTETVPHMKYVIQNAPMLNLYTIQLGEIL